MNTIGTVRPPGTQRPQSQNLNPLARAMAEMEKSTYGAKDPQAANSTDAFSQALARSGGQLPKDFGNQNFSLDDYQKHQEDLLAQKEKERLHKELHDRVNPVDQHDIFKASKERTKKELDELRKDLQKLIGEIKAFHKELDKEVFEATTDQGTTGVGRRNYLLQLRTFIQLLTQKVHSARTWNQQHQARSAKQKSRKGPGAMLVGKKGHAETQAIFDTMHHERSTALSGG